MSDKLVNTYTQGLMDTIMALSREVANLRTSYEIIATRLQAISTLADKTSFDAVNQAINIEELARLAVISADVALQATVALKEAGAIERAQNTLNATKETYDVAKTSTADSKARQTDGGSLK